MKIYLDLCAIQRPLDTPNQVRIALESEAVLGIIAYCENEQAELISSEALFYETEQSPIPTRKEHSLAVLANAKENIKVSSKDTERAIKLTTFGIKPLDALHLVLAEKGNVDYFCTCDDKLLRNAKKLSNLKNKSD